MITKIKYLKQNKNAEITTQQIVILVILLASFIVLLFFLFKLNVKELSEKEICQSSVQLAKKASFFGKIDCKTSYICISGGGECKGFVSSETIKLNLNDKVFIYDDFFHEEHCDSDFDDLDELCRTKPTKDEKINNKRLKYLIENRGQYYKIEDLYD